MFTVPVRDAAVVLPETRMVTVPLPVPELPPVTSSQVTVLAALQMQPVPAVTDALMDSPLAAAVRVTGEMAYVHAPAASWVIVKG
jgi:hypothetical protein